MKELRVVGGKFDTIEKIRDDIICIKCRMIYTRDEPVYDSFGKEVYIDENMLMKIAKRYNKKIKGFFRNKPKRHAPLILEHVEDIEMVLGRLNSEIDVKKEFLDGKLRTVLEVEVLVTDKDTIDWLVNSNDDKKGVSIGLEYDPNLSEFVLKELTVTKTPALSNAVFLSSVGQDVAKIYNKLIKLHSRADDFIKEVSVRKENRNKILLNERMIKEKSEKIKKILLKQVDLNKISRREAMTILPKLIDSDVKTIKTVFSTIMPNRFNRTANFSSLIKNKEKGEE